MNLIGLFGNSTLLEGSSSASFSNFFPFFFIIFLNNMRSSLLAWKTGPLGTEYELLLQRKGGKAKSILPLAVILFIFFTLHIFSIFHLLFFKCKKPSWLHSYCHMCVLSFSSTSLLFSASLLFCFGSHIITPPYLFPPSLLTLRSSFSSLRPSLLSHSYTGFISAPLVMQLSLPLTRLLIHWPDKYHCFVSSSQFFLLLVLFTPNSLLFTSSKASATVAVCSEWQRLASMLMCSETQMDRVIHRGGWAKGQIRWSKGREPECASLPSPVLSVKLLEKKRVWVLDQTLPLIKQGSVALDKLGHILMRALYTLE